MKLHNHKHEHCLHANLKYCSVCNIAYCTDCGHEFGRTNFQKYSWFEKNGTYNIPVTSSTGLPLDKFISICKGHI